MLAQAECMLSTVLGTPSDIYSRLVFLKPHTPFGFNDSIKSTISGINSSISLIPNLSNKKLGKIRCCWPEANCYTICDKRVCQRNYMLGQNIRNNV